MHWISVSYCCVRLQSIEPSRRPAHAWGVLLKSADMSQPAFTSYAAAGVDIEGVETGLQRLTARMRSTWPAAGSTGAVQLDFGYYANVIDVGGIGIAITTDSVGSKVLIAQLVNRYDTIGIDCVAMNVNDLICVGARPISMVDYIAIQEVDPAVLEAISIGLAEGARQAGISIPGGEIAQLRDVVRGVRDGSGFDLAGAAIGTVPLDRILVGQAIEPGDVLIGVESSGIHSNGLTLARDVLFGQAGCAPTATIAPLSVTLGEELLRPTHIYVREALDLLDQVPVKAMMHITGDGFLNLSRVASETGYVIDWLPQPPVIFALIQKAGDVPVEEMFRVFNMGIGFCIVAATADVDRVIEIVGSHGKRAYQLGHTVHDPERRVRIEPFALVGRGKSFARA
jgi:phosphoribosylformylglycinamidine cyclo-ligase